MQGNCSLFWGGIMVVYQSFQIGIKALEIYSQVTTFNLCLVLCVEYVLRKVFSKIVTVLTCQQTLCVVVL